MQFTRRQFLRSAGGVTFLALLPAGRGLFAAFDPVKNRPAPGPIFTALPYIQPGPSSRLVPGREAMRLAWQTQSHAAEFGVRFGPDKTYGRETVPARTERVSASKKELDGRYNYVATFDGLKLDRQYFYEVKCNHRIIAEGYFTTRQPRGERIRFAAFGDNSFGDISDRAIAYQTYQAHPDFVMNTGDNVYDGGLDNEYSRHFFPVYNADVAGPHLGAPLLRSVPFYSVIANHDVHNKRPDGGPVADFDADPDSLAYYTNFHFPLNGPAPAHPTSTFAQKNPDRLTSFLACAGARFPNMANYSYDYGDAHFLCLDSNIYIDPTDAALQSWIEQDLRDTDAAWKFVVFHHPSFNTGLNHYKEQHMRVLSPLFEKCGVDFALHGHEHTYQRTRPMRFAPKDAFKAPLVNTGDRRVPGAFTIDRKFDGLNQTRPDGIIYITTGAGGKHLYDEGFTEDSSKWLHPDDNNADYVECFISDRHSLTIFDLDPHAVTLRQIDEFGQEIDRIRVTKA
jgi:hypothetical protein